LWFVVFVYEIVELMVNCGCILDFVCLFHSNSSFVNLRSRFNSFRILMIIQNFVESLPLTIAILRRRSYYLRLSRYWRHSWSIFRFSRFYSSIHHILMVKSNKFMWSKVSISTFFYIFNVSLCKIFEILKTMSHSIGICIWFRFIFQYTRLHFKACLKCVSSSQFRQNMHTLIHFLFCINSSGIIYGFHLFIGFQFF